jgi:hypothetical protein
VAWAKGASACDDSSRKESGGVQPARRDGSRAKKVNMGNGSGRVQRTVESCSRGVRGGREVVVSAAAHSSDAVWPESGGEAKPGGAVASATLPVAEIAAIPRVVCCLERKSMAGDGLYSHPASSNSPAPVHI